MLQFFDAVGLGSNLLFGESQYIKLLVAVMKSHKSDEYKATLTMIIIIRLSFQNVNSPKPNICKKVRRYSNKIK